MKLDDFNSTFNSAKVSKVLEDKFGTKVSLNKLNLKQLQSLKARVMEAHKNMVKSMPFNSGHRNPEYLEQVALLEAIELRINEVSDMDEALSGKPEFKNVGGAGMGGGYGDTEDEATTHHQMGSYKYIATTEVDGDGDQYYTIVKIVDGKPVTVYQQMQDMDPAVNSESMVSKKILADHMRETAHMFDGGDDEDDDMYEGMLDKFMKRQKAKGELKDLDIDSDFGDLVHVPMARKAARIHNVLYPNKPKRKLPSMNMWDDEVNENKDEDMDNQHHNKVLKNFSGPQTSSLLRLVGPKNISNAKRAIRLAAEGKPIPGNLVMGFRPIVDIVLDILQGGSSYVRRLQTLDKQAAQAAHLDESRYLMEGETEKAQLIMAVKDMVDRVQGMVEDLNKMKVEDLVALTDKMRDEFGQDQATSFTSGANDILSAGIDALTNARSELDNAVLGLTGEAPAAPVATPGAEMPAPGAEMPGAEMGAEVPAEPGAELPAPEGGEEVGRELRESRARMRKRVLESSRFLGKLAK